MRACNGQGERCIGPSCPALKSRHYSHSSQRYSHSSHLVDPSGCERILSEEVSVPDDRHLAHGLQQLLAGWQAPWGGGAQLLAVWQAPRVRGAGPGCSWTRVGCQPPRVGRQVPRVGGAQLLRVDEDGDLPLLDEEKAVQRCTCLLQYGTALYSDPLDGGAHQLQHLMRGRQRRAEALVEVGTGMAAFTSRST